MAQERGHCDVRLWYSIMNDTNAFRIPEFISPLESEVPEAGAREREREREGGREKEDPVELDSNVPPKSDHGGVGLLLAFRPAQPLHPQLYPRPLSLPLLQYPQKTIDLSTEKVRTNAYSCHYGSRKCGPRGKRPRGVSISAKTGLRCFSEKARGCIDGVTALTARSLGSGDEDRRNPGCGSIYH